MKRYLASTALALVAASSAAVADEVVIRQNFDLLNVPQLVTNSLGANLDITGAELEGTNIQNVIQFRDVSADAGLNGDIYQFSQFTDEEQKVINEAVSRYGDVGATMAATNLINVVNVEDKIGGTTLVGDHFLIDQVVEDIEQIGRNRISADDNILAESGQAVSNLANVASITDKYGAEEYGNVLYVDQRAKDAVQKAVNSAWAGGSIHGLDVTAVNGVNIVQLDLSSQTGVAEIDLDQRTHNITQTIENSAHAAGGAANVSLAGTNLGNVVTFVAESSN